MMENLKSLKESLNKSVYTVGVEVERPHLESGKSHVYHRVVVPRMSAGVDNDMIDKELKKHYGNINHKILFLKKGQFNRRAGEHKKGLGVISSSDGVA